MASLVNVRRDVTDNFYRYKMERLQTKIEGKGNGIKTVVVNLSSVAQALARPGSYLIKYFGFELGAQTNIDPPDDRWIINGAHDSGKLQDYLDGFINKFVLCKGCKNPETEVLIKDDLIDLDCKACGSRSQVDPRLKLSSFITKTQPKKGKKDKAERKALRGRKAKQASAGKEDGAGSSGNEGSENGSAEDGQQQQQQQHQDPLQNGHNGHNGVENGGDVSDSELLEKMAAEAPVLGDNDGQSHEWAVDMSAEAVKARQATLPVDLKQKLTLNDDDDDEGGGNTVYDELGTWIQDQAAEKNGIENVDSLAIYMKTKDLAIDAKHRTVLVLVQTIFDDKICAQIPKRASMLKQFTGISERHERALLGGTERFISTQMEKNAGFVSQIVKILQLYYHYDLLGEKVVRKWGTKSSRKYVDLSMSKKIRKAAEPFLTWLDEADEESDDE